MPLVNYSESDTSETESGPSIKELQNPRKRKFPKPSEHKIAGRIRVDVPNIIEHDTRCETVLRQRAGRRGAGGGGFNSFLPSPVRSTCISGRGVRNTEEKTSSTIRTDGDQVNNTRLTEGDITETIDPAAKPAVIESYAYSEAAMQEVEAKQKPLLFRPLSVARKQAKTKKTFRMPMASASLSHLSTDANTSHSGSQSTSKITRSSLFSINRDASDDRPERMNTSIYTPLIHGVREQAIPAMKDDDDVGDIDIDSAVMAPKERPLMSQSLAEVASDLGLSIADRRQLLGRNGISYSTGRSSTANIISFNTDEEYKHNNELRATGEQALHNPVRSIAGGKHSLKQLVSAAVSQKDALEESFAKGKSNRAEAGNKYGW